MSSLKSVFINIFIISILLIAASLTQAAEDPVKVVYNVGVAPLKFQDESGEASGLFPDTWRLWAEKAGKKIQFIRAETFGDSLLILRSGRADLHAGLFKTAEREQFLSYSEPILELSYYLFTHPAVRPITSVEETSGLIVGIQKGGFTEKWLRARLPRERIAIYDSFKELFRAAQKGEVKVFVATELSLLYYLSQNRLASIFAYDKQNPLYSQTYYSATAKATHHRIEKVDKGLSLITDEERQEMENRWIVRKGRKIPADFASLLTEDELLYLSRKEGIKVHNENDWGPYNFNENGMPKGFSVDYVSILGEKIGSNIRFVNYPFWNEFLAMMKTGELDVMLNIAKTSERESYLKFTPPYTEIDQRVYTREEFPEISSVEELTGKRIAVPRGFYIRDFLKARPETEILDVEDMTQAVYAVSSGKADALINPGTVMEYLLGQLGITNLKVNGPPDIIVEKPLPLHMAVSKDRPLLASILEKGMSRISKEEIQGIEEKWLNKIKISEQMTSLTEKERNWLRMHPRVRIGADPGFAPFEFFSEHGRYLGMAADYIGIISKRLGIELKPVTGLTWSQAYEKAQNREIDILPCVGISEERRQFFNYTEPYLQFVRAIITRRDSSVKGLDDLSGARLAVQKNSSHHEFVKEHTRFNPILYVTFEDALLALSGGEADAVIGNLAVSVHIIRKLILTNLEIAAHIPDQVFPLAMAVRKDWPELVLILNKTLATITPEEHWNIRRQWIAINQSQEKKKEVILNDEERAWVEKHPIIRVSSEPDYAPFDFAEKGEPAGFSVDYLRLVAERAGLQLEFVRDTWGNLLEMGKNKEIDLLHTIFKTSERTKHFLFTEPYKTVTNVIYVREGIEGVSTISDLSDKKIIVSQGDGNMDILLSMVPDADFISYKTYEEIFQALSLGVGDATVLDSAVANYLIRKNTLTNIRPVSVADIHSKVSGNAYRLAVRNDWPELRDILQKSMDTVTIEEMDSLYLKWFGSAEITLQHKTEASSVKMISLTPEERNFINNHDPLVFSEVSWEPLSITDNPLRYEGIIADYLRSISDRSGLKFHFQRTESDIWPEVLQKYTDQKIDVVPALVKSDKLGRDILLSEPFVTFPLVIVTRDDVSYIKDTAELNGRKVSVGRGYTSFHFLRNNYPKIKLVEADDVEQAIISLSDGEVFAFVGHMAVTLEHLQKIGMEHLKIAGEISSVFDHRIGVDPKYPEAVSIINKALASMTEEEHRAIYQKWLKVEYEKGIDYGLIWKICIISAVFLGLILFWNRRLAEVNRELSIEIVERNHMEKEIMQAKLAAEAANRAKSVFLANMSHEIRTPMNSVLGFLSLSLEDPVISEKQRTYLSTAYKSSKSLLSLINDILDVSKLESGRLELENTLFNLNEMICEAVRTLDITAKDKGLSLNLETDRHVPENVVGDSGRLKQVLINLVGNAIKFTEKGSVTVHITPGDTPDMIHFAISDTGIGIPADRLQTIFDPFTQADASMTRRFGGTGLGTTISRQLADIMDGEIWAESEEGKGSIFHFTVRMEPAEEPGISAATDNGQRTTDNHRCFRILLAEDIEENIVLAKIRLKEQGHTVIEARNGHEAVQAFQQEDADIILMDVHMPEKDGLEAARQIRELETREDLGSHIPIAALTASVTKDDRKKCVKAGMDAVVGKPVDFDELFAVMEKLVPEGKGRVAEKVTEPDAPVRPSEMPVLEGVDTRKGLLIWKNADAYKSALLAFCTDYGSVTDNILNFIRKNDRDGAYRMLHALKGIAGNLSLTEVYSIAAELNIEVRKKQTGDLLPLVSSLADAMKIAISSVQQLESEEEEEEAHHEGPRDLTILKELFREMMPSFEEYNPDAVEPFLEKLCQLLSPVQIAPIRKQLSRFDFDAARKETVRLAASLGIESSEEPLA
ncbi:transporter substrate-binding domain-containing protein [Desulfococcaceae bacterium HSG8]|nr:transporter substrate-binding domain-containing protein [Desulfococcaceae bacterium HSG8]